MSSGRRIPVAPARGFGLVEAVCSLVVVSILLTAGLTAVGASLKGREGASRQVRARKLAEDLLAEALAQRYREPGTTAAPLGPDSLEGLLSLLHRSSFDDVDDYAGWAESPPMSASGTPMAGFEGWARSAEVSWVSPADLTEALSAESGVKRVTVRVSHNGRPLCVMSSILAEVPHYPEEQ